MPARLARSSLFIVVLCSALAACGDSSEPLCTPGESVACVGPGGCMGGQVCAEDGQGFEECMCATGMDAGQDASEPVDAALDAETRDGAKADANDAASDATTDVGAGDAGSDCSPACGSDFICCGGSCVESNVNNCGGCGIMCDMDRASNCGTPSGGGPTQCLCGSFAACAPPQVCVDSGGTFQCSDLSTDPDNCGEVGNICVEGETCVSGSCSCGGGDSCADGEACCSGSCVDVTSDTMNCGSCGATCESSESCIEGECLCGTGDSATSCADATMSDLGQICCDDTCVDVDDDNCGECGKMCSADTYCIIDSDITPGSGGDGVCCGMELLPGSGFCSDSGVDGGVPDGGT